MGNDILRCSYAIIAIVISGFMDWPTVINVNNERYGPAVIVHMQIIKCCGRPGWVNRCEHCGTNAGVHSVSRGFMHTQTSCCCCAF